MTSNYEWRLDGKMVQYRDNCRWNDLCKYSKYDEADFDTVDENDKVTESIKSVQVDNRYWEIKYSGDTSLELDGKREVMYIPFKEPLDPREVFEVYDEDGNFVANDVTEEEVTENVLSSDSLAVDSFDTQIVSFEREGFNYSILKPALLYLQTSIIGTFFVSTYTIIPQDGLISVEFTLLSSAIIISALLFLFNVLSIHIELKHRNDISTIEKVCEIDP